MKNDHIIFAYGEKEKEPGDYVLLIGITDEGIKTLENKLTLILNGRFPNVANVVIFKEKDKATLKETLRKTGIKISEIN